MIEKIRWYSIFFIHTAIILAGFASPVFMDWKFVLIGALGYLLYSYYVDDCFLSEWQFGKKESFCLYYLKKMGVNLEKSQISSLLRFATVGVIVIAAVWRQVIEP
jgi:hypothetical protein